MSIEQYLKESFLSTSDIETGYSLNKQSPLEYSSLGQGSRQETQRNQTDAIAMQVVAIFTDAQERGLDVEEIMTRAHELINDQGDNDETDE